MPFYFPFTYSPPKKNPQKNHLMFAWSLFYVRIENFQNDDKICSILVTLITLSDLRVTCKSWGKTINESCIVLIKMCIAFALFEVVCVSMQCLVEVPLLSVVWLSVLVSFHTICMTWIFRSNHTFNTERGWDKKLTEPHKFSKPVSFACPFMRQWILHYVLSAGERDSSFSTCPALDAFLWSGSTGSQTAMFSSGLKSWCPLFSVRQQFIWFQRGCPCQDPAGNWTTWRYPDDRKETQTAAVWSCFPFIRSGQNHLARHSERRKKTRQTKEEVGRQHQGMDRPGVWQVPEGGEEQGKMEKTGCKIILGAPMTLAVKGLMMMMMMIWLLRVDGRRIPKDVLCG